MSPLVCWLASGHQSVVVLLSSKQAPYAHHSPDIWPAFLPRPVGQLGLHEALLNPPVPSRPRRAPWPAHRGVVADALDSDDCTLLLGTEGHLVDRSRARGLAMDAVEGRCA